MNMNHLHESRGALSATQEVVLLVYDITDAQRLRKVARLCEAYGQRVQRSVFELHLRPGQLTLLQRRMRKLVQPQQDQVRYYRLCASDLADVYVDGVGAVSEAHSYTVC